MIVPAPPDKPVQVEELEVGQTYWTPSGMGGVWTVKYEGPAETAPSGSRNESGYHKFTYTNSNGPSGSLIISSNRVPEIIFVNYSEMTAEEYEAAGGMYHNA